MDKIIVEGMEFYGYHGTLPEEQSARVFEITQSIVCGRPHRLIESVAEAIAASLLERYPVTGVTVRVKKPQAPVKGQFAWMAVEISRTNPRKDLAGP